MNGYELLAQLKKDVKECFTVPNEWLPEEFRDYRSDSVSLADVERKCDARDRCTLSEFEENAIERAKRCLLYTSPSPRDYAASRMPSSA